MKRFKWALLLLALFFLGGGAYSRATANNSAALVSIRDRLFTKWVSESEYERLAYSTAQSPGGSEYRTDPVMARLKFANELRSSGIPLVRVQAINELSRAAYVVGQMPGAGGMGCGTKWLLHEKVQSLVGPEPYGCCSDFTAGFIALAELQGIEARQVVNSEHSFVEVYDRDRGKWVFLDPQFGLLAFQDDGPLSAWELRTAVLRGERVRWVVLEKGVTRALQEDAILSNYDRNAFRELRVVLQTDVMVQDKKLRRVSFAPKPAAHLVAYIAFARPMFLGIRAPSER